MGDCVQLWLPGPEVGEPLAVTVDVVEQSRVWVLAPDAPLEPGDRVLLERAVPDDARYQGLFEVTGRVRDSLALSRAEDWRRIQERAFVRVSTARIGVEGVLGGSQREVLQLWMLDLSAGGMRVESRAPLAPDAELECRFRLVDSPEPFAIPARVARALDREKEHRRPQAGLRFVDLAYPVATELTRWVFQAQIRLNKGQRHKSP